MDERAGAEIAAVQAAGPEDRDASVWGEAALVAALTAATAWLSAHFEWMETLFAWTRTGESFQLDELIPVLLVLAIGLIWIAVRRYRHARLQGEARRRSQAQLAAALAEVRRLASRLVNLQEDERKALARELHDETGQCLNAIKLDAVNLRDADPALAPAARERATSIVRGVDHVQASVSALVRQLRPVGLDELGLCAAIEHCIDGWRSRLTSTGFQLSLDPDIDTLDEASSLAIYRVVQEALTNCARHAGAGRVQITLRCEGAADPARSQVVLDVRDDGAGVAATVAPPAAGTGAGLGLAGMRERVSALGGTLEAAGLAQGGFRVLARLPRRAGDRETA